MKLKIFALVALMLAAVLTACGGAAREATVAAAEVVAEPVDAAAVVELGTVVDDQGAVSVAVTPVELSGETPTLRFEVAMNTHSVELDMDLAELATLTTDAGRSATAASWSGEPGGHHVSGVLEFPATVEGTSLVEGASQLTLTIRDVDAAERAFVWSIGN